MEEEQIENVVFPVMVVVVDSKYLLQ